MIWLAWVALAAAASGCDAEETIESDASVDVDGAVDAETGSAEPAFDPTTLVVPTHAALRGVWGSSEHDIWVVGELGTIMHFDGQDMLVVVSGTTKNLMAVHGTGPDNVWFVGDEGATLQWDGTRLISHDDPLTDSFSQLGVWVNAADDVWIAGTAPTQSDRVGMVRHWNGEKWEQLHVPGSMSLWEIWGSGSESGVLWMVGTNQRLGGFVVKATGPLLESIRFEGGPLRGVWGAADDDLWVVPYDSPAQHWDGTSWVSSDVMPERAMLATGGNDAGDVWAVGLGGTILHYDGAGWTQFQSPTTENLWSVWGSGEHRAWAAGGAGALVHWDGEAWFKLPNIEMPATSAAP